MLTENRENQIKDRALALAISGILANPVQERLKKEYPELDDNILNELNSLCQTISTQGYDFIYEKLCQSKMEQKVLKSLFDDYLKSQYTWVSEENLSRLFSQGSYIAWRDGLSML